ncbi:hypothetical protein [Mycolicibacterium austroafricanum]|uniref:hypothetical protein n=1 Tax=Mycolicibacterium austroafricanum TaxID=39687 RepID=UPI0010571B04|nr:hypothetical protein [Mycolicibacterium austroafricanum]
MSAPTEGGGVDPAPIPDSANEDIPPNSEGNPEAVTAVTDPEADHRRGMEKSKLKFAIIFVSLTTAGAVALAVVGHFTPGYAEKGGSLLASTGDVLKLLATTSLGFIFGRTLNGGDP